MIDELANPEDRPEAARAARALLGQLDVGIDERAYADAIERLRATSRVAGEI